MDDFPSSLSEIGKKYHELRYDFMTSSKMGLTKANNLFHDPEVEDRDVCKLRDLQREVDSSVIHAYSWDDIDLEHGFHEVPYLPENDRVRFTISESARVEVLRRLSELNRQRYEEETSQGLHSKGKAKSASPSKRSRISKAPSDLPLFDLFCGENL